MFLPTATALVTRSTVARGSEWCKGLIGRGSDPRQRSTHGGGLVITPCRWLSNVLPVGVTQRNPFGVLLMLQPREWVIP